VDHAGRHADEVNALDLARWQFGITTVYHFFFVPITIGLSVLVAGIQTAWVRTGKEQYLRATKFWGKLFLINFAMGVVTGIVQEFQFGMNWSSYSRFVGDIFGAPLAIEGLLAFFMESTFIGLWIFGWDKLPRHIHLATIWLVAFGTTLSALFILGANAWMQHPVGYTINPVSGRAEMTDFFAILGNPILLVTFPHTVLAAWATAGLFVLGISGYHLLRGHETGLFGRSATIALTVSFIASLGVAFVGHEQAQIMTQLQPMKMASAEALWETQAPAEFSLFAIGDVDHGRNNVQVAVPHLLSVLATNTLDGEVQGINAIQAQDEAQYGPGNYIPQVGITYWTFRLMVGAGFLMILLATIGLFLVYRQRLVETRWFHRAALVGIGLPYLANTTGWIFTEIGREPWAVYGLLRIADGGSPAVGSASVVLSLVGYTLMYGLLAVADGYLLVKYARAGPADPAAEIDIALALAY
jgi:cytochrome bd ubiquinol oxidase subunit I